MDYLIYVLITIGVASLPVFLLLYYFEKKDKGEKEPMDLMKKAFWGGMKVVVPIAIVEAFIFSWAAEAAFDQTMLFALLMPFLFVALPEEYGKLWYVKEKIFKHNKFNEVMDGIQYCIIVSMGFALVENIMYTFSFGIETGILRAFTAVPAHALFAGIMGFYVGLAKFEKNEEKQKKLFNKGLMAGVFFHGLYDFLLMTQEARFGLLIFPLLGYMWLILHRAIKKAHSGKLEEIHYFLR